MWQRWIDDLSDASGQYSGPWRYRHGLEDAYRSRGRALVALAKERAALKQIRTVLSLALECPAEKDNTLDISTW